MSNDEPVGKWPHILGLARGGSRHGLALLAYFPLAAMWEGDRQERATQEVDASIAQVDRETEAPLLDSGSVI